MVMQGKRPDLADLAMESANKMRAHVLKRLDHAKKITSGAINSIGRISEGIAPANCGYMGKYSAQEWSLKPANRPASAFVAFPVL